MTKKAVHKEDHKPFTAGDMKLVLLGFIEDFQAQKKYPPTFEEMRVGLGWSTKSLVDYHLGKLEDAFRIERTENSPRAIKVIKPLTATERAAITPEENT